MTDFVDAGARCSEHVGEVFPPRCAECTAAQAELDTNSGRNPSGMEPWAQSVALPDPWAAPFGEVSS